MSVVASKFQRAVALYQQGQSADTDRLCKEILQMEPRHGDALHLRGLAALQRGGFAAGIDLINRSLATNPNQPVAHSNIGNALLQLHRPDEALRAFERALRLDPEFLLALHGCGRALLLTNRHEDALAVLDRALIVNPDDVESLSDRARVLIRMNCQGEALESLDRVLRIKADFLDALHIRASVLMDLNRCSDALSDYDAVLRITADSAEAHSNRSVSLLQLKRYEEALASSDRALLLRPDFPHALNNRGLALVELSRLPEAADSFNRAVQIAPNFAAGFLNLGNTLALLKCHQEALVSYDHALRHEPASASAHFNRALSLMALSRQEQAAEGFANAVRFSPDMPYAAGYALYTKLLCCDWTRHRESTDAFIRVVAEGGCAGDPLQGLIVLPSSADHLRCARNFVSDKAAATGLTSRNTVVYQHDRVRVAYLSADFGEHVVSHVAAGLFEHHDRQRFETIALALLPEPRPSAMRERIVRAFGQFHDVSGFSDREVAAMLRNLEIDIAVDLSGHTSGGRLGILASHPAPVQVNFLGYPGTSGADYMDYVIADAVVIPFEDEDAYVERIIRLPHTYLPFDDSQQVAPDTPTRSQAGLPEDGFIFCAFNNSFKINPAMFDIWMRILNAIPESILWLRSSNDAMERNLRREAAARGVAEERLVFARPIAEIDQHLSRHRLADLFLDTLPYNAHSTAADALWAGLPVLTCAGNAFAGRVAASLLYAVGLPDLITRSLDEYEALACALATTPDMLTGIRARLAANRTTYPLFDTDRFRKHLEAAYITMWERNQRGEPPTGFNVSSLP